MSTLTAHQALGQVPDWDVHNTTLICDLGGSTTNVSWLIELAAVQYVLRVDTPRVQRLGLNRHREALVREQAAHANIAPAVVHSNPELGILLSTYEAGRTWTTADLMNEHNLRQLADCLRVLYALPVVGEPIDLAASLVTYAAQLGDTDSTLLANEAVDQLAQVSDFTAVLCHNDLVAPNVITSHRLCLIDWEYAGAGNPLFDLAVVIEHHALPLDLWRPFVKHCIGDLSALQEQDLRRLRHVYRTLVTLWDAVT